MKFPKPFVSNSEHINVIIETPKGSGNKYAYDPETELFKLTMILPWGLIFPMHFGFIPGTKGEDGDPLDVLILMDEPSYPGCHVECKLIGVIKAQQTEKTGPERNDRLIAASVQSHRYRDLNTIDDLDKYLMDEIINFFTTYNAMKNKQFKVVDTKGPESSIHLVNKQITDE